MGYGKQRGNYDITIGWGLGKNGKENGNYYITMICLVRV